MYGVNMEMLSIAGVARDAGVKATLNKSTVEL